MFLDDNIPHVHRDLVAATGLIAAIEQCSSDDAARLLVRSARRTDRALAEVAADIVHAARLATSCVVTRATARTRTPAPDVGRLRTT